MQEEGRYEREIRARNELSERSESRELRESERYRGPVIRRDPYEDYGDERIQRTGPSREISGIPVIQIADQELIHKIKQIEDYGELRKVLKPFIERTLI